jgi:hypothetical protein
MDETNVTELATRRPHTAGPCHCRQCGHAWIGAIPIGRTAVDCPKCGACKGIRSGFVFPSQIPLRRCVACDEALFSILGYDIMCANCGTQQRL